MLYDPKWEKKIEVKPSFIGFVAWLETKDPDEKYNWGDGCRCAIGQYLNLFGITNANNIPYSEYEKFEGGPDVFVALKEPHTFGAALERARASLPSTHTTET